MKATKERVKEELIKRKDLRDSDNKLIAHVWLQDLVKIGVNPNHITGMDFLVYYGTGQLTNAESIRRTRQQIQQESTELRGKVYEKRHKLQDKIMEELGYSA